jgi:hypothetical protein
VTPGWLNVEKVIQIRMAATFDSSKTPKPGESAVRVKGEGAKPDLELYAQRMRETIERAKDEDPKELKRRIAELQRAVSAKSAAPTTAAPVPVLTNEDQETIAMLKENFEQLVGEAEQLENRVNTMSVTMKSARELAQQLVETLLQVEMVGENTQAASSLRHGVAQLQPNLQRIAAKAAAVQQPNPQSAAARPAAPRRQARSAGPGEKMGKALRSILNVLAQYGPSTRNKVAAVAGYAVSGGGFGNALSEGRTRGWLSGSDILSITDDGMEALGVYDPLPTGPELLASWCGRLGKAEREIVTALVDAGTELTKEQLAERTGYAANGGGFGNALSRLRTRELIVGSKTIALHKDFADAIR